MDTVEKTKATRIEKREQNLKSKQILKTGALPEKDTAPRGRNKEKVCTSLFLQRNYFACTLLSVLVPSIIHYSVYITVYTSHHVIQYYYIILHKLY